MAGNTLGYCEYCGKAFRGNKGRKWCSSTGKDSCRNKADCLKRRKPDFVSVCDVCGKEFETNRKDHKRCSPKCRIKGKRLQDKDRKRKKPKAKKKTLKCVVCQSSFNSFQSTAKFCSDECRKENYLEKREQNRKPRKKYKKTCDRCNKQFTSDSPAKLYCSYRCYKPLTTMVDCVCDSCGNLFTAFEKVSLCNVCLVDKEHKPGQCVYCDSPATKKYCSSRCCKRMGKLRREVRIKQAYVERVELWKLIKRDEGICKLCELPVSLFKSVPHPLAPTIDHVLPIARGGKHSYANTQLAHFSCNSSKSAKIL